MHELPDVLKSEVVAAVMRKSVKELCIYLLQCPFIGPQLRQVMLHETEEAARDAYIGCESVLGKKSYADLTCFSWDKVIKEMAEKQSFLTEILLAVALPTQKIRSFSAVHKLVPMMGCVYSILMKARHKELTLMQKVVTLALANEHTHQKVKFLLKTFLSTLMNKS